MELYEAPKRSWEDLKDTLGYTSEIIGCHRRSLNFIWVSPKISLLPLENSDLSLFLTVVKIGPTKTAEKPFHKISGGSLRQHIIS